MPFFEEIPIETIPIQINENQRVFDEFARKTRERAKKDNEFSKIGRGAVEFAGAIGEGIDRAAGLPGRIATGFNKEIPETFSGQVGGAVKTLTGSKGLGDFTGLAIGFVIPGPDELKNMKIAQKIERFAPLAEELRKVKIAARGSGIFEEAGAKHSLVQKMEMGKANTNDIQDAVQFIKAKTGKDMTKPPPIPRTEDPNLLDLRGAKTKGTVVDLNQESRILRGTKGMTAQDIMAKYPDIQLKRDVPATDIYGNKVKIPEGEALTPYELKGNKILLQDGETYIVSKSQFQNIKGQSVSAEAKPFAPELQGLEESVRGTPKGLTATEKKRFAELDKMERTRFEASQTYKDEWDILFKKKNEQVTTKFSSYQLPGGKNYKEVLIKAKPETFEGVKMEDLTDAQLAKINEQPFKSSHWDEPNVISHLRLNERTYQGKKVTFMEELQSDWAREGRSKGFAQKVDKLPEGAKIATRGNEYGGYQQVVEDAMGNEIARGNTFAEAKENAIKKLNEGIPNNPLLKNWQELSIKRGLQEAVANNSEYFSWINGEQTSARYNLATHLEDVGWENYKGGKSITLKPTGKENFPIKVKTDKTGKIYESTQDSFTGKKLDEVLGKGLADQIMSKKSGTLSGEGLKFGGEWANNLYDKQIKNIVEDVTGGKVETMDMGLPIERGDSGNFRFRPNPANDAVDKVLTKTDIKVGREIAKEGGDSYIITDILGDGKFKAVPKDVYEHLQKQTGGYEKAHAEEQYRNLQETFDISTKTTTQQGIKLTPEIKSKIRGEAPKIKTSGKQYGL